MFLSTISPRSTAAAGRREGNLPIPAARRREGNLPIAAAGRREGNLPTAGGKGREVKVPRLSGKTPMFRKMVAGNKLKSMKVYVTKRRGNNSKRSEDTE